MVHISAQCREGAKWGNKKPRIQVYTDLRGGSQGFKVIIKYKSFECPDKPKILFRFAMSLEGNNKKNKNKKESLHNRFTLTGNCNLNDPTLDQALPRSRKSQYLPDTQVLPNFNFRGYDFQSISALLLHENVRTGENITCSI